MSASVFSKGLSNLSCQVYANIVDKFIDCHVGTKYYQTVFVSCYIVPVDQSRTSKLNLQIRDFIFRRVD